MMSTKRARPFPTIFPVNSVGIVTARDKLAIQWTAEDMGRIAEDFAARGTEAARTFYDLGKDARDWQVQLAQEDVRRRDGRISPVLYRPFDRRFTYYTGKSRGFICMPRPAVMRHMLAGKNLALDYLSAVTEQVKKFSHAHHDSTITLKSSRMSPKTSKTGSSIPIYTPYHRVGSGGSTNVRSMGPSEEPNLDDRTLISSLCSGYLNRRLVLTFVSDQRSATGPAALAPSDILLGYIYADTPQLLNTAAATPTS